MRKVIVLIMAGILCTMLCLRAVAGPSPLPVVAEVQATAPDDTEAARIRFARDARSQTRKWRQRLRDFGVRADADAKSSGHAAEDALRTSWAKADAACRKLPSVNAKFWENAKADFEKASHDLALSWDKSHPEKT